MLAFLGFDPVDVPEDLSNGVSPQEVGRRVVPSPYHVPQNAANQRFNATPSSRLCPPHEPIPEAENQHPIPDHPRDGVLVDAMGLRLVVKPSQRAKSLWCFIPVPRAEVQETRVEDGPPGPPYVWSAWVQDNENSSVADSCDARGLEVVPLSH